jgi:hypothetical protein
MWSTEHSIETEAPPGAIWRLWSDVASWPNWNEDIQRIEISGPFEVGSKISMTPIGQDTNATRAMGLLELAPRTTRGACHPGRPPFIPVRSESVTLGAVHFRRSSRDTTAEL